MPENVVILADDLTGAVDSAAACAAQNLSASVLLHSAQCSITWPDGDIVSIDANTRCLSGADAAASTSKLVDICHEHHVIRPGSILFKKLDSTLRGHFSAELAAMLTVLHAIAPARDKTCIVMAPALPAHGRTTVAGRQMLHGHPVHQGDIPALLAEAGLSCRIIGTDKVRTASNALLETMVTLSRAADVLACDAETEDDLRRIADASMVLRGRAVWAGSAGLAAHLPRAAGIAASTRSAKPFRLAPGPTLYVVGSLASVSRQQADRLSAIPDVATLRLQTALPLSALDPLINAVQSNRDALLVLGSNERCSENDSEFLEHAIAWLVTTVAPLLGALVATGGQTARAVLDCLGIRRLRLVGEVEPGIPFSIADGWTRPLPIVTKAGGFGSPDSLLRCRAFLHALGRPSTTADKQGTSVF